MTRSERLAEIVEIIRDGKVHLARDIADAFEVSVRTIYRDIDALIASGVPLDGERGVGHMLREPVFLPPMALSFIELEALNLGMSIVQEAADEDLKAAAKSVLDEMGGQAANRRQYPKSWGFGVHFFAEASKGLIFLPLLRQAAREGRKLRIDYNALDGALSTRVIRPLRVEFWGRVWTCTAWCEARCDFREFRVDRMDGCSRTGQVFQPEVGRTIDDYLKHLEDHTTKDSTKGHCSSS